MKYIVFSCNLRCQLFLTGGTGEPYNLYFDRKYVRYSTCMSGGTGEPYNLYFDCHLWFNTYKTRSADVTCYTPTQLACMLMGHISYSLYFDRKYVQYFTCMSRVTLHYIKNKHHCNRILFPAPMLRTGTRANAALLTYSRQCQSQWHHLAFRHRNTPNYIILSFWLKNVWKV